jgi:hypothetical protein
MLNGFKMKISIIFGVSQMVFGVCLSCWNHLFHRCAPNRVTRQLEKKLPNFSKNSPKSHQVKKGQNIYNKAQFENPKHLHQTTLETLKYYNKPCFVTAYIGKYVINLLKQKVAPKVTIIFGYFVLSKNHNEPPKVAQLAKKRPIWSLWHPLMDI